MSVLNCTGITTLITPVRYTRFFFSHSFRVLSIARRVIALHLRLSADRVDDLLRSFRRIVERLVESDPSKGSWPDGMAKAVVKNVFLTAKRVGTENLFTEILRLYPMSSSDRKVIERAIRFFSKQRVSLRKPGIEIYNDHVKEYQRFLEVAEAVVSKGIGHDETTTLRAGPFTLINAGGFTEKQMEEVKKVVESADRKLKAKGLGKACYGSIQITNTVGRSSRVLAFYMIDTDELFVRGNLRGKTSAAEETILHELGHRIEKKYSDTGKVRTLYNLISKKAERALHDLMKNKDNFPKVGDRIGENGKKYIVDGITFKRQLVIQVHKEDDPNWKGSLPMTAWMEQTKGSEFVSPYAKKSPSENFAEMISYYCRDLLPDDQVPMLQEAIS